MLLVDDDRARGPSTRQHRTHELHRRESELLHDDADPADAGTIPDGCRRQRRPRDGRAQSGGGHTVLGHRRSGRGFGRLASTNGTRFQVVGIVGDVKNNGLGDATVPEIYVSSRVGTANPARFVVRSTLRADALLPGIRRAIHDVDPTLPIHNVTTVEEVMKGSLAAERVSAGLSGGFALTALLMAMLGIYGVVSSLCGSGRSRSARAWRSAPRAAISCDSSSATASRWRSWAWSWVRSSCSVRRRGSRACSSCRRSAGRRCSPPRQ